MKPKWLYFDQDNSCLLSIYFQKLNITSLVADQEPISHILESTHVDSGSLGTRAALVRPVKEALVYDVVVDLGYGRGQVVVLPHEGHQLWRRPIYGQKSRLDFEVLQHVLKQPFPAAGPLARLVYVKVENAHGVDLVLIALAVQEEEVLFAHLEEAHNTPPSGIAFLVNL